MRYVRVEKLYIIPGYSNYLISKKAKVYSTKTHKKITGYITQKGYLKTCLVNDIGKIKGVYIHRLMALTFMNSNNDVHEYTVDHINGDKLNNKLKNLQMLTNSDNVKKAYAQGFNKQYGENNNLNRFKEEEVIKICELLESGVSQPNIIDILGIVKKDKYNYYDLMKTLKSGKCWSHITKNFNLPKIKKTKSTEKEIYKICDMLQGGYSMVDISKKMSVSKNMISDIKNKKTWKDITKKYMF